MYGIFVSLKVKPDRRERFLKEIRNDALCSVRDEPGCVRFNVFQEAADPDRYHLFEVYRDEAAFDAHRETPHFRRVTESAEDWADGPLDLRPARSVYPASERHYAQPEPEP